MPEGDTIFRTAATLRRWLLQREVTSCRTKVPGLQAQRLVGTTVEDITPKGKHLLITFSNRLVLHSHMRMTGSWHVYRAGERWRRPEWQAKIALDCQGHLAVCFNAPVMELLLPSEAAGHGAINGLGPDVLGDGELDLAEVRRRAATHPGTRTLGELLLDQTVVSGIGNIYRCESLFLDRINPWAPQSSLTADQLDHLVTTAAKLMRANVGPAGDLGRHFGVGGPNRPWVYNRAGRPCRACGTPVSYGRIGADLPRDVYWCGRCQPPVIPEA